MRFKNSLSRQTSASNRSTTSAPRSAPTGETSLGLGGFALNKRDTAEPLDPFTRKDRYSGTAQFDWKLNDWLKITSINDLQSIVSWTSEYQAKSSFFYYKATSPLTRRIGDEPQASTELQFKAENKWINGITSSGSS